MSAEIPLRVVVDASLAAKWIWAEEDTERANRLRDEWERASTLLFAPDLLLIEMHSVIQKRIRRGELAADNPLLAHSPYLGLDLHWISSVLLLPEALSLSIRWNVTIYDALYAALAMDINAPLYTADKLLAERLSKSPVSVFPLLPQRI